VLPLFAEWASAPKVATGVMPVVVAVWEPVHAVPGAVTVQLCVKASPAFDGADIKGPEVGEKSEVTCTPIGPVPPVLEVRTL
jgi:hypothetical protein